ncbi:hypothetical protein LEMLEM_LOCUS1947, partial [Lemmus lemmus]
MGVSGREVCECGHRGLQEEFPGSSNAERCKHNPSTHLTGASVLEHGKNNNFSLSGEKPRLSLLCQLGSQCPPQLGSSTVAESLSNRFDYG